MSLQVPNANEKSLKVILVGDTGVGKSAVVMRLVDKQFTATSIQTMGIDFRTHLIHSCGEIRKLQVWDTAGDERFKSITKSYLNGVHAVVIVCDISDPKSIERAAKHLKEVRGAAVAPPEWAGLPPVFAILGNKSDLSETAADTAKQMHNKLGVQVFPVSAKLGDASLSKAFTKIAALCTVSDAAAVGVRPPALTPTLSFAKKGAKQYQPGARPKLTAAALVSSVGTSGGCFGGDGVMPGASDMMGGCVRPLQSGFEAIKALATMCSTSVWAAPKPQTSQVEDLQSAAPQPAA